MGKEFTFVGIKDKIQLLMASPENVGLTLEVSFEQLLQTLLQLPVEEKIRMAERLKASAAAERSPKKKVTFTVLKTNGKTFKFNREEANER